MSAENNNYMLIYENTLSGLGALLLLYGYWKVSIHDNHRAGLLWSCVGSCVMVVAFSLFGSLPFVALNVVWASISLYGYFVRTLHFPVAGLTKSAGVFIIFSIALTAVALVLKGHAELSGWAAILMMLFGYYLFASNVFHRSGYVINATLAAWIAVPHYWELGNVSSIAQVLCTTAIAVMSFYKFKCAQPREIESIVR
ncbi:hypothetical protein AB4254_13615 [Vibrio breoganii]